MAQIYEYIKMALDNIRSNKGRSVLTMLGIIIGISSVIMIMAIGAGASNQMSDLLTGIAGGQIYIAVNSDSATGADYLNPGDLEAVKEKVDGVKGVTCDFGLYGNTSSSKGSFDTVVSGGTEDYTYTQGKDLLRGRYYTAEEVAAGKRVCVINKTDAINLFGTTDVIGMTLDVTIDNITREFQVIGIRDVEDDSGFASMFVYNGGYVSMEVPYTVSLDFEYYIDSFYSMYIITEDGADSRQVSQDAIRLLENRHQNVGEDMFYLQDFQDQMSEINSVMGLMTTFIAFVAAISLLVGGIGVMNIMLVSVTERTREIGIRKALGAKTKSIMIQFLMEAAIITCIGGIIGIILGIGGAYLICSLPMLGLQPGIKISTIIMTTIFSSFVGIFFGIYPARKAARLSPIEALRRN